MPDRLIENIIPILVVRDFAASVEHYAQVLGFEQDWSAGTIGQVSRDGWRIMLAEGDQGQPGTWLWMGVTDADAILEEYRASGANIIEEPVNYPHAYEFRVADLDGNVLRVGGEPKA